MPLATNQQLISAYGHLPWWRSLAPLAEEQRVLKNVLQASRGIKELSSSTAKQQFRVVVRAGLERRVEWLLQEHPTWGREQIKGALMGEGRRKVPSEGKIFAQAGGLSRALTPYESKVDFATLDAETIRLASQGVERVRRLLEESKGRLLSLIANRHKAGTLTAKFVLELELRGLGQLVPLLRETLGAAFRLGQREASKELKSSSMTVAKADKGNRTYQVKLDPTGLPPEKALEFFERKAVLWGADVRQPLLSVVRNILFEGIKQGTGLRELIQQIEQAYLPWLGDPDQAIEEIMLTPYRLETMVRTNITEALNEGRKAQLQSAVDDGFVIGLAFSAVLDTRTTEVCRYLDEKIFPPDSPELDRLTPPRHWSCRSTVVPVTRLEGPVAFITPAQVAHGVKLSGKGFAEALEVRRRDVHEVITQKEEIP